MGLPRKVTRARQQNASPDRIGSDQPPIPDTDTHDASDATPAVVSDQPRPTVAEPDPVTAGSGNDETQQKRPYVIPQHRSPGTQGFIPRSSSGSASEFETVKSRPVRQKRKPGWMKSNDWVMSQTHTHIH